MVSIIIINYRQKEYLYNCIDSIFDVIKSHPFEIIIVNNSPEEKFDFPKNKYPNVYLVDNDNKGFSNGNNAGAKYAKGGYLLFLNPDTLIKNDFLNDIVNYFSKIEFGAAGLKLFYPDNNFQISFGNELTLIGEIYNKRIEKSFNKRSRIVIDEIENKYLEVSEVNWVSGAALFIRKNVFDKIGGFDEKYFMYYEDVDLCNRLSLSGYGIYFYPFSNIIHYKGENTNKSFLSDTYYFAKQSQLLYYKKFNSIPNRILIRLYLSVKSLLLGLFKFNKNYFEVFLLAMGIRK
jgi:GT2 family glycosyltransferase